MKSLEHFPCFETIVSLHVVYVYAQNIDIYFLNTVYIYMCVCVCVFQCCF